MFDESVLIQVFENPLTSELPVTVYYSPFPNETHLPEMFADMGIVFTHIFKEIGTGKVIYFTLEDSHSISETTL